MSQEALGDTIGLTRTSITNIESGNQRMPLHVFMEIAAALGVSTDELLAADDLARRNIPTLVPPKTAAYLSRLADRAG